VIDIQNVFQCRRQNRPTAAADNSFFSRLEVRFFKRLTHGFGDKEST